MSSTLRRALRTLFPGRSTAHPIPREDEARVAALETHTKALYDHVRELTRELQQLRQDEARRAAEHATMVDQLTRLYKRVSARIAREEAVTHPSDTGESVLALRSRLGR